MEKQEHTPRIDGAVLTKRVEAVRSKIIEERLHLFAWQDALVKWDKDFKVRLEERFGSRRYAQQVPAWQKLIGGTPEAETDITDQQRNYILQEVQKFLEEFSAAHGISYD
jgi:hypothetical protein